MSLSDCTECWDTPCTCGYMYREYSDEAKLKLARVILSDAFVVIKKEYLIEIDKDLVFLKEALKKIKETK